jgi:CRISPR-associated protein (TIGR03984 family)
VFLKEDSMDVENGLTLNTIFTQTQNVPAQPVQTCDLKQIITTAMGANPPTMYFVAYLHDRVIIERYTQDRINTIEPRHLQRFRLFHKDAELFLWCSEGILRGRLRFDEATRNDQNRAMEVIEAHQMLFGHPTAQEPDATELSEQRGTRLRLPFLYEGHQRICLKTRNYIGYLKTTNQATYVDCRFVSFTDGKQDLT